MRTAQSMPGATLTTALDRSPGYVPQIRLVKGFTVNAWDDKEGRDLVRALLRSDEIEAFEIAN